MSASRKMRRTVSALSMSIDQAPVFLSNRSPIGALPNASLPSAAQRAFPSNTRDLIFFRSRAAKYPCSVKSISPMPESSAGSISRPFVSMIFAFASIARPYTRNRSRGSSARVNRSTE